MMEGLRAPSSTLTSGQGLASVVELRKARSRPYAKNLDLPSLLLTFQYSSAAWNTNANTPPSWANHVISFLESHDMLAMTAAHSKTGPQRVNCCRTNLHISPASRGMALPQLKRNWMP
jgi:hypothetical protein